MQMQNKKAAIEMSIGTIIIIVLGVTMLILGMILIRNIMCSALGLTGDVNDKVSSELNRYFGETGDEVACIGAGGEAIKISPDQEHIVHCAIKADEVGQYEVKIVSVDSRISSLTEADLQKWLTTSSWTGRVAPGDNSPKKAARLRVPDNAPEGPISLTVEVSRDGQLISTQELDFEISRIGFVRATMC